MCASSLSTDTPVTAANRVSSPLRTAVFVVTCACAREACCA